MALARRRKAFRKSLAETGYVEDRNVVVEYRWSEKDNERPGMHLRPSQNGA